jgi:hypothetical protein
MNPVDVALLAAINTTVSDVRTKEAGQTLSLVPIVSDDSEAVHATADRSKLVPFVDRQPTVLDNSVHQDSLAPGLPPGRASSRIHAKRRHHNPWVGWPRKTRLGDC